MRFRQIKHFLLAGPHAHSEKTAGADGQQRLHQLIAGIMRVPERIEKSRQALHAVGSCDSQGQSSGSGHAQGKKDVDEARASGDAHEK